MTQNFRDCSCTMVVLPFRRAIQTLQQYILKDKRLEITLQENDIGILSDVSSSRKINNIWNSTTGVLSAGQGEVTILLYW